MHQKGTNLTPTTFPCREGFFTSGLATPQSERTGDFNVGEVLGFHHDLKVVILSNAKDRSWKGCVDARDVVVLYEAHE